MSTFDLSVLFKMVDRFSSPLKQSMHNFNKWNEKVKQSNTVAQQFSHNLSQIGRSASLYLTAPLVLAGGAAVKTAVSFQSSFTGVIKTVTATKEELADLKIELMKMPSEIPLRQEEIFRIAEAAGQLGIETPKIAAFTKVMADLGVTTNLTSDEAATQLARFANITAMSKDDFEKLGSTIVGLGNNLETTEKEIVAMAMRLAGTGSLVGMSQSQIMGFAGALSSVGIEAQMGGTAFSQVMTKINKEIGSGSQKMQAFAKIAGKPVEVFEKLWKEDAAEALILFTEGLKRLDDKGKNVSQILDALSFDGFRVSDSLLRAAGSGDKFREAIRMGTGFWKENLALAHEANLRYSTMASRFSIAWNEVRRLAAAFGDVLAPALLKLVEWMKPVIIWFGKLSPATKGIIIAFGLLVAAIGPLALALAGVTAAFAFIAANAAIATTVGLIGAAFVAMGTALVVVINNLDAIKEFFTSIPDKIINFANAVERMALSVFDNLKGMIPDFVLRWMGSGEGTSMIDQARVNQLATVNSNNKSSADITIKVASDNGTSATIGGVTKRGDAKVNVINDAYLGMGAAFGGGGF